MRIHRNLVQKSIHLGEALIVAEPITEAGLMPVEGQARHRRENLNYLRSRLIQVIVEAEEEVAEHVMVPRVWFQDDSLLVN